MIKNVCVLNAIAIIENSISGKGHSYMAACDSGSRIEKLGDQTLPHFEVISQSFLKYSSLFKAKRLVHKSSY